MKHWQRDSLKILCGIMLQITTFHSLTFMHLFVRGICKLIVGRGMCKLIVRSIHSRVKRSFISLLHMDSRHNYGILSTIRQQPLSITEALCQVLQIYVLLKYHHDTINSKWISF